MIKPDDLDTRQPIQVKEAQLRDFIVTGAVTRIQAMGSADGFELHVDIGTAAGALGSARGGIRIFSSLNTLTALVKRLGGDRFDVVIGEFSADELSAQTKRSPKARATETIPMRTKFSTVKLKTKNNLSSKRNSK